MATWSWSEVCDALYTTTWPNRKKKTVPQIYKRVPLWNFLMKKGNIRTSTGGKYIEYPMSVAEASTVKYIGRGDKADLTAQDHLRTAQVPWKTIMGSLVRFRTDDQKNRGKTKFLSWMNADLKNLERSIKKQLEQNACLGTGTYGSKAFYGLTDWVPAVSTNTVAGVARATYTWFKNTVKAATAPSSVHLVRNMRNVFNTVQDYDGTPDFCLTDQTSYEIYQNSVPVRTITEKRVGDAEYERITFRGVVIDFSSRCTDGYMYILDTDHIWFELDSFENWKMTPWKEPVDQPFDKAAQILLTGNMCCDFPKVQAVITGIA